MPTPPAGYGVKENSLFPAESVRLNAEYIFSASDEILSQESAHESKCFSTKSVFYSWQKSIFFTPTRCVRSRRKETVSASFLRPPRHDHLSLRPIRRLKSLTEAPRHGEKFCQYFPAGYQSRPEPAQVPTVSGMTHHPFTQFHDTDHPYPAGGPNVG